MQLLDLLVLSDGLMYRRSLPESSKGMVYTTNYPPYRLFWFFSFVTYLKYMNKTMTGTFAIPESRPPILLLSGYFKAALSSEDGKILWGVW